MIMMIVPILVALVGNVTVVSAVHPWKTRSPNDRIGSLIIMMIMIMIMMMMIPILVTLVGIVTDVSPVHREKAR